MGDLVILFYACNIGLANMLLEEVSSILQ
jgi:hypothetical protein